MTRHLDLPVLFTPAVTANHEALAKALQMNFDSLNGLIRAAGIREEGEEDDSDDDGLSDSEPAKVTGVRFHDFYREKRKQDNKWFAEIRWDELNDFVVTRYKVKLWRWDPATNDYEKYPTGHAKAGEYLPPQVKNVYGKDKDDNTYVSLEMRVLRKKTYKAEVRAFGVQKKGAWSDLSAAGTASDTKAPPAPTAVYIDVDPRKIHGEVTQTMDPEDSTDVHPDIAYMQAKVTTDSAGNNLATYKGRNLFDGFVGGALRKTFNIRKPSGQTYYFWARNVDGSGNKSAWVSSAAGNVSDPPTPTDAPQLQFKDGGRHKVTLKVTISPSATHTDADIDRYVVRLDDGDGDPRYQHIDLDKTAQTGSFTVKFKNVKEGNLCRVKYRPVDEKGNKGGWSPEAQATAYDVPASGVSITPTNVVGIKKRNTFKLDWGPPSGIDKLDISHYEAELYVFGGLTEWDYHVKATQIKFPRNKNESIYGRVRTITKGGTASAWVSTNSVSLDGITSADAETLDSDWFPSGSIIGSRLSYSSFHKDWMQDETDFSGKTFTAPRIQTATSGNARVVLGASGESDRIGIDGTGGTRRGNIFADSAALNVKAVNGADLILQAEGGGLVDIRSSSILGTSNVGAHNGNIIVRVHGTQYKLRLYALS